MLGETIGSYIGHAWLFDFKLVAGKVIEVDVLLSGTKMHSRNETTCWG